jgi:hypothetical protein
VKTEGLRFNFVLPFLFKYYLRTWSKERRGVKKRVKKGEGRHPLLFTNIFHKIMIGVGNMLRSIF